MYQRVKLRWNFLLHNLSKLRGGPPLTRNRSDMGLNPMKGSFCFFEQETLTSLLSTVWYQERSQAWLHNQTIKKWEPYGRLTLNIQISPLVKYRLNQFKSKINIELLSLHVRLINTVWLVCNEEKQPVFIWEKLSYFGYLCEWACVRWG